MGKNKLSKFAEMETFSNVIQVPFHDILRADYPMKGHWNSDFFKNDQPIVLELGCGKGEYTVGLAEQNPNCNYIGVDIKGARIWTGAKAAIEKNLGNVGFLRTNIELVPQFFAAGEVSEIWLTFPDPQMKSVHKRLTSTRFVNLYRQFLKPGGIVHLKTDSNFQYQYTEAMAKANHFEIKDNNPDIYSGDNLDDVLKIKTYYEQQWLSRGITIKYISFVPGQGALEEPDVDIELDTYRSFGRGVVAGQSSK